MSDLTSESHYELIAGYALGTLTADEQRLTEGFLAADPALREVLAQDQAVMGLMAEATAPVKAPAGLRSRIMQAAEQQAVEHRAVEPSATLAPLEPHQSNRAAPVTRWNRRSGHWYGLATGTAALLTLALGIDNYRLRQQASQAQAKISQLELAQTAEKLHEKYYAFRLKPKDANGSSMGLVAVNLEKGQAELALDALPPLEPNEAYHLWAFTKDKKKMLFGRFTPSESGAINQTISLRPEDYPEGILFMRVSREPAVTPPDPSRRVLVLTSEL
jgi:Anti-sigma-K factor rskA